MWFADEIPINDRSSEFWGLPGLVLQALVNERLLVAAVKIEKLDEKVEINGKRYYQKKSLKY